MNLILNFSLEKKFINLSRDFITDMKNLMNGTTKQEKGKCNVEKIII